MASLGLGSKQLEKKANNNAPGIPGKENRDDSDFP